MWSSFEFVLSSIVSNEITSFFFDLMKLLNFYQERYHGAMYSGCGGGYFYIVADESVPGTFQVKVRITN